MTHWPGFVAATGSVGVGLLAQTAPLPPSADPVMMWVYAVLQGGALMLLAYILCMRDPQSRKDDTLERERRDKLFSDSLLKLQDKFDDRSKQITGAVEEQTKALVRELDSSYQKMAAAIANTCKATRP